MIKSNRNKISIIALLSAKNGLPPFWGGLGWGFLILVFVSCSGIYDNVEKYADGEIIYADRLDGIMRVQVGYERVEIDLLEAGRIPASQIQMGKARKTVIECEDFTEPGNRRVIDSVCSWVNVTGLTQLKNYRLCIYTEDKYGNRSIPFTTDVRPYTEENLNALELVVPMMIESTSAVVIEWKEPISAHTHTVFDYSYAYTDKDGMAHSGIGTGDVPSFFVENIEKEKDIPVALTCRIIPALSNFDGTYTPILDTVNWQTMVKVHISQYAEAAIFLKTPETGFTIDREDADLFPIAFSWIPVPEATGYALKISPNRNFPDEETYTVNVGNVGEYVMDYAQIASLPTSLPFMRQERSPVYWTVTPVSQSAPVTNQIRGFTYLLKSELVDRWPLNFAATGSRMTVTRYEDYVHMLVTGIDPVINTTQLGRPLSGTQYFFALEYKNNRTATNGEWFYCVSGGPQGGKSTAQSVVFEHVTDWTWFEYDITRHCITWGWGINNDGGAQPQNHFLRFDPISEQQEDYLGYEISIRNMQVIAFDWY